MVSFKAFYRTCSKITIKVRSHKLRLKSAPAPPLSHRPGKYVHPCKMFCPSKLQFKTFSFPSKFHAIFDAVTVAIIMQNFAIFCKEISSNSLYLVFVFLPISLSLCLCISPHLFLSVLCLCLSYLNRSLSKSLAVTITVRPCNYMSFDL